MAEQMTKSQLIEKIAGETEVAKKEVKGVLEALVTVGHNIDRETPSGMDVPAISRPPA